MAVCPLCILTAIVLGGGGSMACGIQWVKGKLGESRETVDGCQTLSLNDPPATAEQHDAADEPALVTVTKM